MFVACYCPLTRSLYCDIIKLCRFGFVPCLKTHKTSSFFFLEDCEMLLFTRSGLFLASGLLAGAMCIVVPLSCSRNSAISELAEVKEKISSLDDEIKELTAKEKFATDKVAELTVTVKGLTDDKNGVEATVRDQIAKASASAERAVVLKEENNKLRAEISDLATKLDEAKTELTRRDREKELAKELADKIAADKSDREKGFSPLTKWSKDPDVDVRKTLIYYIVENRVQVGYDILVRLMASDGTAEVEDTARNALSYNLDSHHLGIGKEAVSYLIGAVEDPSRIPLTDAEKIMKLNERAGIALINIGVDAVDPLIDEFNPDNPIRDWAMNIVIKIGTAAKPRLQIALTRDYLIGPSVRAVLVQIEENECKVIRAEAEARAKAPAQVAKPAVVAPALPVQHITVNIPEIKIPPTVVNVAPSPAPMVSVSAPRIPVVTVDRCGGVSVRN